MRSFSFATLTLLAILLAAHNPLRAQLKIRLGINGGVNFANQSFGLQGPTSSNTSARPGIVIGGLAEIGIADIWTVQLEPRYIQKGMKISDFYVLTNGSDPTPTGTADQVHRLDYFEIPLLLKASFGTNDVRPYIFAGPSIGFLLSAKYSGVVSGIQGQGTAVTFSESDVYNSLDVSVDMGVGTEISVSEKISLTGSARYSVGLKNVNNEASSPSSSTVKSNGIQILVGTIFTL